jgi:L-ascorbate metabolism protein UlaG (beta-lactamase superfamily)
MKYIIIIIALIVILHLSSCILFYEGGYYKGKPSSHFNGNNFFNPNSDGKKNFSSYRQSKKEYEQQFGKPYWPQHKINITTTTPLPKIEDATIHATFVGHSTFLLQFAGLNILTDPIWSMRASPISFFGPKRIKQPGINFVDLPPIDIVLISHSHYDHLDLPTIKMLKKHSNPHFFAGLGTCHYFNVIHKLQLNCTELDWQQSFSFNPQLNITFLPAKHWSKRMLFGNNAMLWGAFALSGKSGKIYFAGDTGFDTHFADAGNDFNGFDLALLPIGAYKPQSFMSNHHTSPREAVLAMQQLKAKKAIAMHFETFQLASDNFSDPLSDLQSALQQQQISSNDFVALQPGEKIIITQQP